MVVDLRKSAYNVFSQFGEDGMVDRLFELIGVEHYRCGEVGAGDGMELSNTLRFWQSEDWEATLVEVDPVRFSQLENRAHGTSASVHQLMLTAANVNDVFTGDYDLLSLDIDGDDWFVFEAMEARPRVILVEFNPSMPHWLYLRPAEEGHEVGASALAMRTLGEKKGYRLAGATHCNVLMVRDDVCDIDFEDRLDVLLGTDPLTYMITDFGGRPLLHGNAPPWGFTGFTDPCLTPVVEDEEAYAAGLIEAAERARAERDRIAAIYADVAWDPPEEWT